MSPLHIVHGVLSLDVGGLERVVLSLVRAGVRRGQKNTVVCIEKPGELADEVRSAGAEVISLGKPPGRHREFIHRAREVLDRLKPDLVHTHQIGAAWYLGSAAARQSLPVLHTEHGNQFARDSGGVARLKSRLFYWKTSRLIDRFCCVSADIAAAVIRWRTIPRAKVEVVPNGIDTGAENGGCDRDAVRNSLGIPLDARVIGTVGRLAEVKRQDRLLRAAASSMLRFPNLWILIVGDGPERNRLHDLAMTLGISDRVCLAGYQPEPSRYLRAMDAFALTSQSEGLPISLLEAWAAGLPVVCTSVGGIPDVVAEGVNGLLVPNDDGSDLARALSRILDEPALAVRLGLAGRQTVQQRFSLDTMADAYEQRYRALISGYRGKT